MIEGHTNEQLRHELNGEVLKTMTMPRYTKAVRNALMWELSLRGMTYRELSEVVGLSMPSVSDILGRHASKLRFHNQRDSINTPAAKRHVPALHAATCLLVWERRTKLRWRLGSIDRLCTCGAVEQPPEHVACRCSDVPPVSCFADTMKEGV